MTRLKCGSLTIGKTTETESIAALLVGLPRPRALHTRFGPGVNPRTAVLDAVKIENADELAFFYGEE